MNLKKIISEWGLSLIGKKALHEDDVQKIIGEWGISIIGKKVLHEDDIHKFDDYPFKGQSHKCIGIDNGYLKIRFSGIVLRISPTSFYKTSPPHFLPFDRVKYISSKGKIEFGVIVEFSGRRKPKPQRVYILEVKGKVKTTLYEKDRLSLLTESDFESRLNNELSKIILETIKTSHQLVVDEMGWIKMDDLIKLLHYKIVGWESLRYYDILRMIDSTEEKLYEVKAKRIGPAYKNKYEWYIRRYLPD